MKTIFKIWYKLTIKDFDKKLSNSRCLYSNILESTNGKCNHFYNISGDIIRGFSKPKIKFENTSNINPLISKYR